MKTKKQIALIVAAGLIIVGVTYALIAGGERLKGSFVEGKKIPVATDIKTIRYHDNDIDISWQKPKSSTVATYKLFRRASANPFTEQPAKSLSDSKWEELIEEIDGTTVIFNERAPKENNKKWAYSLVGLDGTKYVGSILIVPMDSIMPIKDDNGAGGTADLFWTSTKYNGKTVPHEIYRSKLGLSITTEDAKTKYLPQEFGI